jgi:hypothetical protein
LNFDPWPKVLANNVVDLCRINEKGSVVMSDDGV